MFKYYFLIGAIYSFSYTLYYLYIDSSKGIKPEFEELQDVVGKVPALLILYTTFMVIWLPLELIVFFRNRN